MGEKKVPERKHSENPFFEEKMSDLDGIYNSENDYIWAVNREKENWRGGKNNKENFHKRGWYGYPYTQRALHSLFCLKKALSIIIREALPVALRYGDYKFGNNWIFQQDNGTAHIHQER